VSGKVATHSADVTEIANAAPLPRRVIKLGGSLLEYGDSVVELRRWLAAQSPAHNLLVVGGGAMADAVREADRLHGLSESAAHWLCVRAMSLNARLIAALLPAAIWTTTLNASAAAHRQANLAIVDPWHFLREEEPRSAVTPLPQSWDVTSDSIAAQVAVVWCAAELVLLKSALPPAAGSLASASAAGYVDRYFSTVAEAIPRIRCVNLRERAFLSVHFSKSRCEPRREPLPVASGRSEAAADAEGQMASTTGAPRPTFLRACHPGL